MPPFVATSSTYAPLEPDDAKGFVADPDPIALSVPARRQSRKVNASRSARSVLVCPQ
jgi:hypothetical protein